MPILMRWMNYLTERNIKFMNWKTKITRTVLHSLGYRKAKSKTHNGNPWYYKRRVTRNGNSRCTIQVEFRCDGYVDVNSIEKRLNNDGVYGDNQSSGLRIVRDLKSWEKFAFCF